MNLLKTTQSSSPSALFGSPLLQNLRTSSAENDINMILVQETIRLKKNRQEVNITHAVGDVVPSTHFQNPSISESVQSRSAHLFPFCLETPENNIVGIFSLSVCLSLSLSLSHSLFPPFFLLLRPLTCSSLLFMITRSAPPLKQSALLSVQVLLSVER